MGCAGNTMAADRVQSRPRVAAAHHCQNSSVSFPQRGAQGTVSNFWEPELGLSPSLSLSITSGENFDAKAQRFAKKEGTWLVLLGRGIPKILNFPSVSSLRSFAPLRRKSPRLGNMHLTSKPKGTVPFWVPQKLGQSPSVCRLAGLHAIGDTGHIHKLPTGTSPRRRLGSSPGHSIVIQNPCRLIATLVIPARFALWPRNCASRRTNCGSAAGRKRLPGSMPRGG